MAELTMDFLQNEGERSPENRWSAGTWETSNALVSKQLLREN
jgi:hypothetical protein